MPENEFQLYLRQSNSIQVTRHISWIWETEGWAEKTEGRERNGWGRNQATNSISGSSFCVSLGSKRRDNVLSFSYSLKEQKVLPQQCCLWGYGSLVGARLPIESTKVIYKKKSC